MWEERSLKIIAKNKGNFYSTVCDTVLVIWRHLTLRPRRRCRPFLFLVSLCFLAGASDQIRDSGTTPGTVDGPALSLHRLPEHVPAHVQSVHRQRDRPGSPQEGLLQLGPAGGFVLHTGLFYVSRAWLSEQWATLVVWDSSGGLWLSCTKLVTHVQCFSLNS